MNDTMIAMIEILIAPTLLFISFLLFSFFNYKKTAQFSIHLSIFKFNIIQ